MEIKHLNLIAVFSCVCLCVRLCVSQAPPARANSRNNILSGGRAPSVPRGRRLCPPGSCPPQWISMLEMYSGLLNQDMVMQPVCQIALNRGFISSCDTPHRTCGNHQPGAEFCCCPARQLSKVQRCLPRSQFVCVPDNFAPWQSELQSAIFGNMLG